MRKIIWILALIFFGILFKNDLSGQMDGKYFFINCPEEKMLVHLSQESVFTGEIMWFKIYCSSPAFPYEGLSNLAFIELVSSENTSVLRKKILLKHGTGSGEFEIPKRLSTGLYYVLIYSNWMKNFGEQSFSRKEIAVINPELPYKSSEENHDYSKTIAQKTETGPPTDRLKITTDRKSYNRREQVTLKISTTGISGEKVSGDFSVSVSRKEPEMNRAVEKEGGGLSENDPGGSVYLPDYKGITLSGRLVDSTGKAVAGVTVTASTPGRGTELKSSITDNAGVYNFLLKPEEGEKEIILTLPGTSLRSVLEESFWNGFRNPPNNVVFSPDKDAISYIKERYRNFQIQARFKNQFFTRNRQPEDPKDSSVFYSEPYQLIEFKNYIYLDSLREYFYELVPSVKFSRKKGETDIAVFDPNTMDFLDEKPGVFVDGVLYDNYAEIAKLAVRDIDRIAIIAETYYYGIFTFGGIIDIHTKKSDFNCVSPSPDMIRFIYPMADRDEWKFSSPVYSIAGNSDRIPDFRYLLYWQPDLRTSNSQDVSVKFYTGDLKGIYIIKVIGMSENGEMLEAENEIYVDN